MKLSSNKIFVRLTLDVDGVCSYNVHGNECQDDRGILEDKETRDLCYMGYRIRKVSYLRQ